MLDADLPCAHCGYNLVGLDSRGRCPECGTAVGLSWVRRMPPRWGRGFARRLEAGVRLVQFGIAGAAACLCLCLAPGAAAALTLVPLSAAAAGCWLVTARPPDDERRGVSARTACRLLLAPAAAVAGYELTRPLNLPEALGKLGLPTPAPAMSAAALLALVIAAYALAVAHVGRLAGGLEARLRTDARLVLWATGAMVAAVAALLVATAGSAACVSAASIVVALAVPAWLLLHLIFFDRVGIALAERLARVWD